MVKVEGTRWKYCCLGQTEGRNNRSLIGHQSVDKVERIDFDLMAEKRWESMRHFMLAFSPKISRREDTYL